MYRANQPDKASFGISWLVVVFCCAFGYSAQVAADPITTASLSLLESTFSPTNITPTTQTTLNFVFTNNGPDAGQDVVISFTATSAETTLVAITGTGCAVDLDALVCTYNSWPLGTNHAIEIIVTAGSAGSLVGVDYTITSLSDNPGSNSGSISELVKEPQAGNGTQVDLVVEIVDFTPTLPKVGDATTMTIRLQNTGNIAASNVNWVATLPQAGKLADLAIDFVPTTLNNQCTIKAIPTQAFTCDFPTMASETTFTASLSATLLATGIFSISSLASTSNQEPTSNNSDAYSTTIAPADVTQPPMIDYLAVTTTGSSPIAIDLPSTRFLPLAQLAVSATVEDLQFAQLALAVTDNTTQQNTTFPVALFVDANGNGQFDALDKEIASGLLTNNQLPAQLLTPNAVETLKQGHVQTYFLILKTESIELAQAKQTMALALSLPFWLAIGLLQMPTKRRFYWHYFFMLILLVTSCGQGEQTRPVPQRFVLTLEELTATRLDTSPVVEALSTAIELEVSND